MKARAYIRPSRVAGRMNSTEAAYSGSLELLKKAGEITHYSFEPCKWRLASNTHYTPDFMVILPGGNIEFHEVKGFWEDDARVKIKVVAELYPQFSFIGVTRKKGAWIKEEF